MIRIFSVMIPARIFTLFISEVVLLFACFLAAAAVDPDVDDLLFYLQYDGGLARIAIVTMLVIAGLFFRNLYAQVRVRNRLELFQNLSFIFGIAFLGQGVISYLDRDLIVQRKIMLLGSALALGCLFGWRLLFDSVGRNAATSGRVLFLGNSATNAGLSRHFETHPEIGLSSIGYLGTPGAEVSGMRRLGSLADLDETLDEQSPDCVVIGRREDIKPGWVDDFLALRFGGIRVEEASTLYEKVFARKCVTEIWPSRLIFAGALEPPALSVKIQALYSQALAIGALAITLPLFALAAALIRIESGGGAIERERRVGLHDRPFNMYRFRCEDTHGNYSRSGRLLKKCRLDLLPRLFNVLRGEMAIVGPRPHRPAYAERLGGEVPFYRQRHRVKPGLTGWADVHSISGDTDALRELEYDLYYVENLSPLLDSMVLLLAVKGGT